jgi:hypothetical protein
MNTLKPFFDDENPFISKLGETDSSVLEGEFDPKISVFFIETDEKWQVTWP